MYGDAVRCLVQSLSCGRMGIEGAIDDCVKPTSWIAGVQLLLKDGEVWEEMYYSVKRRSEISDA